MVTASAAVRRAADQRRALGLNSPGVLVPNANDWGETPNGIPVVYEKTDAESTDQPWIQTFTGRMFHVTNPDPFEFNILDIATALSNQCRFNGHVREFYSVAQHCVEVSRLCRADYQLEGLVHDAAEAYIGDVVTPLKHAVEMGGYLSIERRVEKALVDFIGVPVRWPWPPEVVYWDRVLLMTEHRDLQVESPAPWGIEAEPLERVLVPMTPREARTAYLRTYAELIGARRRW